MASSLLTRHRRKVLDHRESGEERSHLGTPLREGRRAAKSNRMIFERRPLDPQYVTAGRLDQPAQFMRQIPRAPSRRRNRGAKYRFEFGFPAGSDGQLRQFHDHGVAPWPGIHEVPASGTPAMAADSTVSATKSSFSKW